MRKEKQLLLNEIKQKVDSSSAMIVTSYKSLTPNISWDLRKRLAERGSLFEVVRKRVFLKAAEQSGISFDGSLLGGHVGVVFINQTDAMEPAKVVCKFSDENGAIVQILCGQVEGKLVSGGDLIALSKLPNLQDMRAILLGLFTAPMAQMLSVLEAAIAEKSPVEEQNS